MEWRRPKVIVFESDDWGGLERGVPNLATQRRLSKNPHVVKAFGSRPSRFYSIMDTLESVADLDALFQLLLHFRGGDGRPAVFTPVCLLASPDYDAIKANGCTAYVDIGIDQPFPPLYRSRGDIIAKMREGIRLGVWAPESHNTRMAAHIDPHKWVRLLREKKDPALNVFFNAHMIGRPSEIPIADLGKEFDSMGIKELRAWIAVGTRYFRKAFGYAPRATGISDARSRCRVLEEVVEKIMVENGVKVIVNAVNHGMGAYNARLGLTYIKRNVNFEPLSEPENRRPAAWRSAYRDILRAWDRHEPAIINNHRLNYVSQDPALKAEGFRQLERLLEIIRRKHPEAVYRSSHALARTRS